MSMSMNNPLEMPTSVQAELPRERGNGLEPDALEAGRSPAQALDQAAQVQALGADRIEISSHEWWETNVALIFEGPGSAADKAEALQQLGPAPDVSTRILIDRDGNVSRPELSLSAIDPVLEPSADRSDLSGRVQAQQASMAPDISSARTEQRDLLLKAAEQIQEQAAVLREQFSHTDMDSYATRLELSKEINQLDNFAAQMRAAASAPSHTVDLSRQEINYGPDPEAEYTDRLSGIEHVPYLEAAEREHQSGLWSIAPVLAQLQQADIEVNTDFTIVSPPDPELDMDEELEL